MQSLQNIIDGQKRSNLIQYFFLLNVALRYQREAQRFSDWWEDFYAYISAIEKNKYVLRL